MKDRIGQFCCRGYLFLAVMAACTVLVIIKPTLSDKLLYGLIAHLSLAAFIVRRELHKRNPRT